ncbi:hypothetical protein ABSA28_00251 [Candidatus Hepatincolaceae symbiont of Richtersius coronifer]
MVDLQYKFPSWPSNDQDIINCTFKGQIKQLSHRGHFEGGVCN